MTELAIIPSIEEFIGRGLPEVHICQPFSGTPGPDTSFPMKYQEDPWCWSRQLGFHRVSEPGHRRTPLLGKGVKEVSERHISARQAMALGAGIGTSNAPDLRPVVGETVAALLDVIAHDFYRSDPDFWAELGQAAAGKAWIDGSLPAQDYIGRIMLAGVLEVAPHMDDFNAYKNLILNTLGPEDEAVRGAAGSGITAVLADGMRNTSVAVDVIELYVHSIDRPRTVEVDRIIGRLTDYLAEMA